MRTRCVRLAALVLLLSTSALAQDKRLITEEDLFRFQWVADPQISPDGRHVAYVHVEVNDKRDGYNSSIWSVPSGGGQPSRRLTSGPRDTFPRWSPDGTRMLFLRGGDRDKEGKPQPGQVWLMPLEGGEPFPLTSLPKGAESPVWSPDGKTIAFLSRTNEKDLAKAERQKKPGTPEERESDVRVITRAVYRFNAQGYLDPTRPSHIWTIAVPQRSGEKPKEKQLTTGYFEEQSPRWSADGSRIYFTSTRVVEPYYDPPTSVLYAVPITGGDVQQVAAIQGQIGQYSVSPDGKRIAFRGTVTRPVHSYQQTDLFVVEVAPGSQARDLAPKLDADVGGTLAGDQHPPRGNVASPPVWSHDGQFVFDIVGQRGTTNLRRFRVDGVAVEPVTSGNQEVFGFAITPDGSRVVALISSATEIGDLHLVGDGGKLQRLTNINGELWSQLNLTQPEEIWYQSFDGKRTHAWVQKPPDFDPSRKYPLILNIHGGPHAAYGHTFDHEFHWMAAKGYVVLYPNPRGSSTYGKEFGNLIQYRYPGDDHKDLMAGVDELLRRGYIDARRLGITGGSGGGVLTNHAITQTDRFAAAVSQRSISDWADFWYTADFTLFQPSWFRGAPWEDSQDFTQRSAITHVARIKTPLMLIEGEHDYRTPPSAGGEQLFRALKYLRRPTVMVRFPEETHELSRSGQPWRRIERLRHMLNWFDKYLLGKPITLYDLPSVQPMPKQEKPGGEARP